MKIFFLIAPIIALFSLGYVGSLKSTIKTSVYSEKTQGGIRILRNSRKIGDVHFGWDFESVPEMSISKIVRGDDFEVVIEVVDNDDVRHSVKVTGSGENVSYHGDESSKDKIFFRRVEK